METTSLSEKNAAVLLEVESLPNKHVDRTVILNDITHDINMVLLDDNNKHVKFHSMERSTEEAVSTLQSVV